ncbi:hypothetical protein [Streptomyces ziwulingensis]|uniref:LPXTG cell wall anchor domain-containing protein n=1 Tax=Streptomyces ziwulingensis TaxID=1045501 RepID=A0ABP9C850_9ACTN
MCDETRQYRNFSGPVCTFGADSAYERDTPVHYGELATTGSGLSLFGLATGQTWLVAAAFALTLGGALLIRLTFRRGKGADEA